MSIYDTVFVFDIETVPDGAAASALIGESFQDEDAGRQALEDYHLQITDGKNPFPRQMFHKIVAISFVRAKIVREGDSERYEVEEVRSGGDVSSTEEDLVRGFFHYAGKFSPRFVSYNGRGFDLPVLKYRAMKYRIAAPWLYKVDNKWENYQSRYSSLWHCDLQDVLSDYGASARAKMNEVCAAIGLPGKLGTDGGDVMGLYDAGLIDEIRDYCETDVINTFLLYIAYMHHIGSVSDRARHNSEDALRMFLEKSPVAAHREYLEAWSALTS